jgi:serine/threonine protein kinase
MKKVLEQTIAGRYRVLTQLQVGGMAVTYRAWNESTDLPVVIKVPNQACQSDPESLLRFFQETKTHFRLRHPSIVEVVDAGEFKDCPYIAMRYLPGGSLRDRRKGGSRRSLPDPTELHLWLRKVALAIDFLHLKGFVHRDVKPSNIFFDAYWTPFLGDFGLTKFVGWGDGDMTSPAFTSTGIAVGTLAYMAPEQVLPKQTVDSRADQYALAVIVYEFVSGRRPFLGEREPVIVEILHRKPRPLQSLNPRLPRSLCAAVHRALSRSPEKRFESCEAFERALLQDVQPYQRPWGDVARLQCPACMRVFKSVPANAGENGKCPKCKQPIAIAKDLSAVWLAQESPEGRSRDKKRGMKDREVLPKVGSGTKAATDGPRLGVKERKQLLDSMRAPSRFVRRYFSTPRKKFRELVVAVWVAWVVGVLIFAPILFLSGQTKFLSQMEAFFLGF